MMHYDHYFNNYKDAIVYKIFLKSKTRDQSSTTLDEAFEIIRMVHDLTNGLPQIVYLVGWQYKGHDSKYPAWDEVGTQCASRFSADPRESLHCFFREAKQFNAKVSFHINMIDAYENSPLWDEYVQHDLISKKADGSLDTACCWGGELAYNISPVKEFRSGYAQKRIQRLLADFPEIRESGTIHIDAFMAKGSPGDGITVADDQQALKDIVDFWHSLGVDVTTEIITGEDMIGYFPSVYHMNLDERMRLKYPADLICGGDPDWNRRKDVDFYTFDGWPIKFMCPAAGCLYEEAWGTNYSNDFVAKILYEGKADFLCKFFHTCVVCRFLNRFRPMECRQTAEDYIVEFTEGVRSHVTTENRYLQITENGRTVVDGDFIFVDLEQDGKPFVLTFCDKEVKREVLLPAGMAGLKKVRIEPYGGTAAERIVNNGKIMLDLPAGIPAVIKVCE